MLCNNTHTGLLRWKNASCNVVPQKIRRKPSAPLRFKHRSREASSTLSSCCISPSISFHSLRPSLSSLHTSTVSKGKRAIKGNFFFTRYRAKEYICKMHFRALLRSYRFIYIYTLFFFFRENQERINRVASDKVHCEKCY